MPYRYKIYEPGYYHVYNRGNDKKEIFHSPQDYVYFIKSMGFYKQKYNIDIICYCLMPNHFHLFVRLNKKSEFVKFIKLLQMVYAQHLQEQYNCIGHVFQGRYKAKIVEGFEYALYLSAYIHNNPKVACLIDDLRDWRWSSYPDYLGVRNGKIPNKSIILNEFILPKDYFNWVKRLSDDKIEEKLQNLTIDY